MQSTLSVTGSLTESTTTYTSQGDLYICKRGSVEEISTSNGLNGYRCFHCRIGVLTESTTTYTSQGDLYICNKCNSTFTNVRHTLEKKEKKKEHKETWFEKNKKEKNFFKQCKKKK